MDPDKPSIDERYNRAMVSSHLEVRPERASDVDLLIAAGWCRDGVGTALFRLRNEWDSVSAEHERAESAAQLAKESDVDGDAAALTARALIMVQLQTLEPAKSAICAFAVSLATRERFMRDDQTVMRIACRTLGIWVAPNCPHCQGRGFNGGFGIPMVLCTVARGCGGSGKRSIGTDLCGRDMQFVRSLLEKMDRKTDHVGNLMIRFLRQREKQAADDEALMNTQAVRELRDRLVDLRSAQAAVD
jgi:hypothetical protein